MLYEYPPNFHISQFSHFHISLLPRFSISILLFPVHLMGKQTGLPLLLSLSHCPSFQSFFRLSVIFRHYPSSLRPSVIIRHSRLLHASNILMAVYNTPASPRKVPDPRGLLSTEYHSKKPLFSFTRFTIGWICS